MTVTTLLLLKDLTPTQKSYVTSKLNTKEECNEKIVQELIQEATLLES